MRDALPEPKTVADVLREAAALVRQGWCRHEYAIGSDGQECDASSPDAVAWCLAGAIDRAAGSNHLADAALKRVSQHVGLPMAWNDYYARSGEAVGQLLERAAR